jgi:hypothetical protein
MENINPREILKNLFQCFKDYPPDKIKIIVYTDDIFSYYISINNGKYSIERFYINEDEEDVSVQLPDVNNVNKFFDILKNEKITRIVLENFPRRRQQAVSLTIFRCEHIGCYDQRNKNITNDFKGSELYTKTISHPEFLRQEGFFNIVSDVDFGKKQKRSNSEIKYLKSF